MIQRSSFPPTTSPITPVSKNQTTAMIIMFEVSKWPWEKDHAPSTRDFTWWWCWWLINSRARAWSRVQKLDSTTPTLMRAGPTLVLLFTFLPLHPHTPSHTPTPSHPSHVAQIKAGSRSFLSEYTSLRSFRFCEFPGAGIVRTLFLFSEKSTLRVRPLVEMLLALLKPATSRSETLLPA